MLPPLRDYANLSVSISFLDSIAKLAKHARLRSLALFHPPAEGRVVNAGILAGCLVVVASRNGITKTLLYFGCQLRGTTAGHWF